MGPTSGGCEVFSSSRYPYGFNTPSGVPPTWLVRFTARYRPPPHGSMWFNGVGGPGRIAVVPCPAVRFRRRRVASRSSSASVRRPGLKRGRWRSTPALAARPVETVPTADRTPSLRAAPVAWRPSVWRGETRLYRARPRSPWALRELGRPGGHLLFAPRWRLPAGGWAPLSPGCVRAWLPPPPPHRVAPPFRQLVAPRRGHSFGARLSRPLDCPPVRRRRATLPEGPPRSSGKPATRPLHARSRSACAVRPRLLALHVARAGLAPDVGRERRVSAPFLASPSMRFPVFL